MNPSNHKRLRENKAKSCSDNSQTSGEEVFHSSAPEAKENLLSEAEDLVGGGKPSAKTKPMVFSKTKCWLSFKVPSKGKFDAFVDG